MKKTHEKSKFLRIIDGSELEEIQKKQIVLQVECIQAVEGYKRAYLIECVEDKDYERTTLEGILKEKSEMILRQEKELENLKNDFNELSKLYKTVSEAYEILAKGE